MRHIATAFDYARVTSLSSEDCDAAIAALDDLIDLDATVQVGPESHRRLFENAFSSSEAPTLPEHDDITLQAPSPIPRLPALPALPEPAPFPTLPPSLAPAVVAMPVSGWTPDFVATRRSAPVLRPRANRQLVLVAAIWTIAASILATLAFMVTG